MRIACRASRVLFVALGAASRAAAAVLAFLTVSAVVPASFAAEAEPLAQPVRFDRDVLPILSSRCFHCHGPDEKARQAELRLDQADDATRQRDDHWVIKAADPEHSELLRRVGSADADAVMPPPDAGPRLTAAEIDTLRRWIASGAGYSTHWAFTPPRRPEVPPVSAPDATVRNDIDRFILAELDRAKLQPSPPADPYTLVRRVSLDLTGLPPSPEMVEEFIRSYSGGGAAPDDAAVASGGSRAKSPDASNASAETSKASADASAAPGESAGAQDAQERAYEALVDRLLDSPAYGERWARMWLDLARYADSSGYGSDPLRMNIWPYRDWVIQAFNQNMPYDQFTIEQLAGDLLPDATEQQRLATAFHRNTMTNVEGGTIDEEFRVAAVKDRVATTVQVWMGLTMGCAQCHSHKFDPITQREYYQFFAIFNQTEDNDLPTEYPTMPLYTPELDKRRTELNAQIARLKAAMRKPRPQFAAELAEWEVATREQRHWSALESAVAASAAGAAIERRDDGSWQSTGPTLDNEALVFSAESDLSLVTAFRLERWPDAPASPAEDAQAPGAAEPADAADPSAKPRPPATAIAEARLYVRPADAPPARFVRIELPGKTRILALAEVQVFSGGKNVALAGAATQSSTAFDGDARRAIDGATDGRYDHNTTTHTRSEESPWWELDLGKPAPIDAIVIWNRTDAGVATRLAAFRIKTLDAERKVLAEQKVVKPPMPRVALAWDAREVKLSRVTTSDGAAAEAAGAIDGKPDSAWTPSPGAPPPVAAAVEFARPEKLDKPSVWTLVIEPAHSEAATSLGRIRWSLTARGGPVALPSPDAQAVLATPAADRTAAQRERLEEFFRPYAPSLAKEAAQLARLETRLTTIKPVAVPVMVELPTKKRRATHVLLKGNFATPGEEVHPALLGAFNPPPAGAPIDRLAVARWLVSRDNPLTSRVAVNRLWAQLFGAGLVETEEDFGTQGQAPSHPELLDWLAVEFMDRGWDVKRMLRLMVRSATYRQSSLVTPAAQARDPRNRLLWRYPRRRLDAEGVRDQALAVSGLLSDKVGGPSVYPPQPEGLWRAAFNGQRTWTTSAGEDRYRRAIYVFWRRTTPYPSMVTFDAPSREICTLRRLPTNTPLQALVTMNDPVYVEMAQALGRRLMREGGLSTVERARFGLRLALCHPVDERQVAALAALYERSLAHYREDAQAATRMATDPLGKLDADVDPAEAAAWTVVANVLLNLDGVLTKG